MEYTLSEFLKWENEQKVPEVSDKELMFIIRKRWHQLYEKLHRGEITNKEYSIRRRRYENMITELGGLLNEFIKEKQC